jgi:hypothetical protein
VQCLIRAAARHSQDCEETTLAVGCRFDNDKQVDADPDFWPTSRRSTLVSPPQKSKSCVCIKSEADQPSLLHFSCWAVINRIDRPRVVVSHRASRSGEKINSFPDPKWRPKFEFDTDKLNYIGHETTLGDAPASRPRARGPVTAGDDIAKEEHQKQCHEDVLFWPA